MLRQALDVLDIITGLRIDYLPAAGATLLRLRLILTLLGLRELFGVLILGAPTRTTDATPQGQSRTEHVGDIIGGLHDGRRSSTCEQELGHVAYGEFDGHLLAHLPAIDIEQVHRSSREGKRQRGAG